MKFSAKEILSAFRLNKFSKILLFLFLFQFVLFCTVYTGVDEFNGYQQNAKDQKGEKDCQTPISLIAALAIGTASPFFLKDGKLCNFSLFIENELRPNKFGSSTGTGFITFTYASSSYTFTVGTAITPLTPTLTGTPTSCTSSPSLPAGLSISPTTCVISGTPSTVQSEMSYTITIANSSSTGSTSIRITVDSGIVTTFVGNAAASGFTDATGTLALFKRPKGVALDSSGNLYVADSTNNAIRKVTPAGVVTTLAGSTTAVAGSTDGTGTAARFNDPYGVAVDTGGNIYIGDSGNNSIRKITATGVVTTLAGSTSVSGSTDATGTSARFSFPHGVAVDSAGSVYVADRGNNTIRKVTSAGVVTTLAGSAGTSGILDATGNLARFTNPEGVAVDSSGNVYVADNGSYLIRKVTSTGVVTTIANSTNGIYAPNCIAVDTSGNLYVTQTFNIAKVTSSGAVSIIAGAVSTFTTGYTDGTGSVARFSYPIGIAIDSSGNLFIGDSGNFNIRKIVP